MSKLGDLWDSESAACHAAMDAKEARIDAYGYGGQATDFIIERIAGLVSAHGSQPDHIAIHPTRAGQLHAVMVVCDVRDQMLAECGPRPPWWRPIKRRRWNARRAAIVSGADSAIGALFR